MKKINWSDLDLDELERLYYAAREKQAEADAVERQMNLCIERECGHPPFKNDGTSDKRYDCEGVTGQDLYSKYTSLCNELYYSYHTTLFEAIGLPLSDGDE